VCAFVRGYVSAPRTSILFLREKGLDNAGEGASKLEGRGVKRGVKRKVKTQRERARVRAPEERPKRALIHKKETLICVFI